jgi:hypothetical protein
VSFAGFREDGCPIVLSLSSSLSILDRGQGVLADWRYADGGRKNDQKIEDEHEHDNEHDRKRGVILCPDFR